MILSEHLKQARHVLKQGGIESADLDARILLAQAMGFSAEEMILKSGAMVPSEALERFNIFIQRRLTHEPVSRILGRREFWGLSFKVTPDTLDPRPDSETLVSETLKILSLSNKKDLKIADFGTGTGCLLLALLSELPKASGIGIDISQGAIDTAKENALALGLSDRARFEVADWKSFPLNSFDWILCNPPYIPETELKNLAPDVANFDPHGALFAGRDGLDCYRDLARVLPGFLTQEGGVSLETGFDQASQVADIFNNSGFTVLHIAKDIQGHDRCVMIKKSLSKRDGTV